MSILPWPRRRPLPEPTCTMVPRSNDPGPLAGMENARRKRERSKAPLDAGLPITETPFCLFCVERGVLVLMQNPNDPHHADCLVPLARAAKEAARAEKAER